MISFRAKLAVSDGTTPYQWNFIDSDYRLYTIGYSSLPDFPATGRRLDIQNEDGCYYDENNAWLALGTEQGDSRKVYRFFFTDSTNDNYIWRDGDSAGIWYNGRNYSVFGFTNAISGSRTALLLSEETIAAGVRTGSLYPTSRAYSIYGQNPFTSDSVSAFFALTQLTPSLYPITYYPTNVTLDPAPAEAAVGDTVTVGVSVPAGYTIRDPSSNIVVRNNGIVVPHTWDASTSRFTFTMPDPS